MRDFNFRWAESITTFAETSRWVLIMNFSSEVKITAQRTDYYFESDNQFR